MTNAYNTHINTLLYTILYRFPSNSTAAAATNINAHPPACASPRAANELQAYTLDDSARRTRRPAGRRHRRRSHARVCPSLRSAYIIVSSTRTHTRGMRGLRGALLSRQPAVGVREATQVNVRTRIYECIRLFGYGPQFK